MTWIAPRHTDVFEIFQAIDEPANDPEFDFLMETDTNSVLVAAAPGHIYQFAVVVKNPLVIADTAKSEPIAFDITRLQSDIRGFTELRPGDAYSIGSPVSVRPGGILRAGPGTTILATHWSAGITVDPGGALELLGADTAAVLLTGTDPFGDTVQWRGVRFFGDPDSKLQLSYVRVEDAADDPGRGAIEVHQTNNRALVTHVQVARSDADGFRFIGGNVDASHLIAHRVRDTGFELEKGWDGNLRRIVAYRTLEGVEFDATAGSLEAFTLIGDTLRKDSLRAGDGVGLNFRSGAVGRASCGVVVEYPVLFNLDNSGTSAEVTNVILAQQDSVFPDDGDEFSERQIFLEGRGNRISTVSFLGDVTRGELLVTLDGALSVPECGGVPGAVVGSENPWTRARWIAW